MIDPKRLLDDPPDGFAAGLLRAHKEDRAPDSLYRATLAAMGVGVATGTSAAAAASGTGAAAQAAKAIGAGGGAVAPAASILSAGSVKWIAAGILGGAVTISTMGALREKWGPSVAGAASGQVAAAVETIRSSPVAGGVLQAEPIQSSADMGVPGNSHEVVLGHAATSSKTETLENSRPAFASDSAGPPFPAAPVKPARTPAVSESSLLAEVGELDRVRGAIAGGRAKDALRSLDDYHRSFPAGALGPEATVLRIEALVAAGQMGAATSLADQFLRTPASAPHATRVRSLIKGVSNR